MVNFLYLPEDLILVILCRCDVLTILKFEQVRLATMSNERHN